VKWKLHRSLVFWGGVVVMGFIGWAWRDSGQMRRIFRGGEYFAMSLEGGLAVGVGSRSYLPICGGVFSDRPGWSGAFRHLWNPGDHGWIGRERVARWRKGIANDDDPAFEVVAEEISGPRGGWTVYVPYWLAMLLLALPWGAALGWSWRRAWRANAVVMEGGGAA
jgi:hypothetical protein